jgi:energy-coupling factor transport system permease protein
MSYRRRASPLHAARAAAGIAYCLALAAAALIFSAPLPLGAVALATLVAGLAAGVGAELRRAATFAVPLGVLVAVINALVTRDGLTVIWRLGDLPVLGHVDVTLEATAYGGILGLRAATLVLCAALYTAAVDPDEVLRLFRRVSFRSALTATLATRMVPLLARDSRRMADAQRCRSGAPATRVQLLRATTAGFLDRALYGAARRPPRYRQPYSRHDLGFLASAAGVLILAVTTRVAGLAPFAAYPVLKAPLSGGQAGISAGLVVGALLPFVDRRGIER